MKKIIVPAEQYDFTRDSRILIPFVISEKVGFMNPLGEIVVEPKYIGYRGEFDTEDSLVIVAQNHLYANERKTAGPVAYCRPKYGLMNSRGEEVVEVKYFSLSAPMGGSRLYKALNMESQYGAIDELGNEVIPFGKYAYVGTFNRGRAIVKVYDFEEKKEKWGVIDEEGHEVKPPIYDHIRNFVNQDALWWQEFGEQRPREESVDL